MSFYDRKEVRDVLAYLKLLANPADEVSLLRIINVPARGIGQTTVKRLLDEAIQRGKPVWEMLSHAGELAGMSATAVQAVQRFRAMIERFRKGLEKGTGPIRAKHPEGGHRPKVGHGKLDRSPFSNLAEIVKTLIREVAYKDELTRLYPDASDQEARWASVEEVVNAVASYAQRAAQPTIAGFLQEVALTGSEADDYKESKLERNAVALMTLHAAKGLEFKEVYIVGMEEGTLPHHRSIAELGAAVDEERRLCYVGVTRAQRRLTLTLALNRRKWGKARPTQPSRFLYELTGRAENPNYLAATQGHKRSARTARRG
jgi:DNA helicase-2/ATP-dependent DNA helicase PcrA